MTAWGGGPEDDEKQHASPQRPSEMFQMTKKKSLPLSRHPQDTRAAVSPKQAPPPLFFLLSSLVFCLHVLS